MLSLAPENSPEIISLKSSSLACITSWINYGLSLEDLSAILPVIMQHMADPVLFEDVIELLIALIVSPANASMKETMSSLLPLLENLKPKLDEAIQEEDELAAKPYARLITSFADAFPSILIRKFYEPTTQTFFGMLLSISNFPGIFAAEQDISELPLNSWYLIQDVIYHEQVGVFLEDNEKKLQQIKQDSSGIFIQLLEVCLAKGRYPVESEYLSWTLDIRNRFTNYRCDLGDTCIYIYQIIGEVSIELLVDKFLSFFECHQSNPALVAWQDLEIIVFFFKFLGESISSTEDKHLPRLISILTRINDPSMFPKKFMESCLRTIGSLGDWLQHHSEVLSVAVNFVLPFLSHAELSAPACSAFKDLCDIGGAQLIKHSVEPVIDGFWSMHDSINLSDRMKIMEALTMLIVHESDPARSNYLFSKLLDPIFTIIGGEEKNEALVEMCLHHLIALSTHLLEIDGRPVYPDLMKRMFPMVQWIYSQALSNHNLVQARRKLL